MSRDGAHGAAGKAQQEAAGDGLAEETVGLCLTCGAAMRPSGSSGSSRAEYPDTVARRTPGACYGCFRAPAGSRARRDPDRIEDAALDLCAPWFAGYVRGRRRRGIPPEGVPLWGGTPSSAPAASRSAAPGDGGAAA